MTRDSVVSQPEGEQERHTDEISRVFVHIPEPCALSYVVKYWLGTGTS